MSNKTPADALRLVPCPFCGADPGVSKYDVDEETTKWAAGCDGSGAPESWVYVEHYVNVHGDTKADVIAAWNRRAAPASPLPGGGWQDMTCDEQFALATEIAANIGYVLQPEPDHPDCPHARQGMSKILSDQLADKSRRLRPLPAAPTGDA